jgi:hypothetical protein
MIKVVGLLMAAAAAGYWMFRGKRTMSPEMSGDTSQMSSGDDSMLPGRQPEYAGTPSPSVAASPRRDDTVSASPQRSVADYPGSQSSG